MYSLASLGLGLAAEAAGMVGIGDKGLMALNRGYARTKKLKAPPKTKAVQKRRKANKQASKQRKSK